MATKKSAVVEADIPADIPEKKLEMTAKAAQLRMANRYKNEQLVEVSVSPLYANEFSRNQPIIYNGIRINVPTDGKIYKVPYSFALEIRQRIAAADQKFKLLNRMADVQNNFDGRDPGTVKLFR